MDENRELKEMRTDASMMIVEKMKNDEITDDDIADIQEVLGKILDHPESGIVDSITFLGAYNKCDMYLDDDINYLDDPESVLKRIVFSKTKLKIEGGLEI